MFKKRSGLGGGTRGPALAGWRYAEVRNVELKGGLTAVNVVIDAPPLPEHEAWKPRSVIEPIATSATPMSRN